MSIIVNGELIQHFIFPGGECQVVIKSTICELTNITAIITCSDDLISLLLTVNAIRHINPNTSISLLLPYVPYARQDRVCSYGEALSIQVITSLINHMNFDSVIIYDPHSDVTPALLDRCKVITQAELFNQSDIASLTVSNNMILLAPDAGAEKKIQSVAKNLSHRFLMKNIEIISASKIRNVEDGKITGIQIHGEVQGKSFVIVDDICDGGQTFINLAQQLKIQGANELYLYVTHGIFSKGLSVLHPYFKAIYCHHTLHDIADNQDNFLAITQRSFL